MLNPMDMDGHTIVVTGASSGIGRATAILLSQLHARVVLVGRNEERLQETQQKLTGTGHQIYSADLAELEQIPELIQVITREVSPLKGLVHSAGIQTTRPVRSLSSDEFDRVMRINTVAAVQLTRALRRKGSHAANSSIVFLASVMGLVGQPGLTAYSASKGALIAVTRSLAMELARDGIRVNCVVPGHVRTEMAAALQQSLTEEQFAAIEAMHPLGLGEPLDVAHAIAFLLGETARWITGTALVVDGGYTAH